MMSSALVLPSLPTPAEAQSGSRTGEAEAHATGWVPAHNGRARLVAAHVGTEVYAGIEIALANGWKTYWRHPGDAGGVPPTIDWSASTNLAAAAMLFPAPTRLIDSAGLTLGYKHAVLIPIRLAPKSASEPILLKLALEYGICREICIPAEATFQLTLPPSARASADPARDAIAAALAEALERVPRPAASARPHDPRLLSAAVETRASKPRIVFTVDAAGADPSSVDAFAEGPDTMYLPQPERVAAPRDGQVSFAITLANPAELADIKGKPVRLTLVSARGACEVSWTVTG